MGVKQKNKMPAFFPNFFRQKYGILGLIGITCYLILAILAPIISKFPEGYGQLADIQQAPNGKFLFGTDAMGLSVLDEVIWGTRTSIRMGIMVVIYATLLGVTIGLITGYCKGILSEILLGITDLFLTIPMLPLMIMMAAIMGPSISNVEIIIGILSWPRIAKVTRAATLEVLGMKYIEAEQCLGIPTRIIVFKHALGYCAPFVLSEMTILVSSAILTESGISFLGLGDPNVWSWGKILQNAQINGIFFQAWWCSLFPSLFIIFFVISFSLLSMGIKECLNCYAQK